MADRVGSFLLGQWGLLGLQSEWISLAIPEDCDTTTVVAVRTELAERWTELLAVRELYAAMLDEFDNTHSYAWTRREGSPKASRVALQRLESAAARRADVEAKARTGPSALMVISNGESLRYEIGREGDGKLLYPRRMGDMIERFTLLPPLATPAQEATE
jgi:hypothetical protein